MIESADRSHVPPRLGHGHGLSRTAGDELARLHGRQLGVCGVCGRPVFLDQNFTRLSGNVVHVRCPITTRGASPLPPSVLAGTVADDR
jgi:hypothetical protein